MIGLKEDEIFNIMCGLKAYVEHYSISGKEKFERILLFCKLNDYLKESNKTHYISPYKQFGLDGAELLNYLSWKKDNEQL